MTASPPWADATALKTAVVLGAPGSGKTSLVDAWIADYIERGGDVLILDPSHQFPGRGIWPDEGPEAFLENIKSKFTGLLVLDDADRYLSATPRGIWRDLFTSFRHWGVNLLVVARRPQGIPKDVIASADEVIIFRLSEVHARKYLGALLGEEIIPAIPRERFCYVMASPFEPEEMSEGTTQPRAVRTLADSAGLVSVGPTGDWWADVFCD